MHKGKVRQCGKRGINVDMRLRFIGFIEDGGLLLKSIKIIVGNGSCSVGVKPVQ